MPRSTDLDKVAPDDMDPIQTAAPVEPKTTVNTPKSNEIREKIYNILGRTKHPFSSFLVRPKVFDFQERDNDEEIILVLRQHWWTNVSWLSTSLLILLIPLFIVSLPPFSGIPVGLKTVFSFFLYLITFAYAFEKFLSWYFNVYIITDERVIDIDFNNLLNKEYSEAELIVIQDITSKVVGFSQTMLNYGNIYIQTAAEVPEIIFEKVPNPEKVIKVLQQLRQEEKLEELEGRIR